MYDLEIIVPAEGSLQKRFQDFNKYGLQNIQNVKVKLIFLASHDNTQEMFNYSWDKNIDFEVLFSPYKHVAQRIYWYYEKVIRPDTAKWYMRIDEDSLNDIAGLYNNLNYLYDYTREYHIGTDINSHIHDLDFQICHDMGFKNWWSKTFHEPVSHTWEISITSNAAIKTILGCEASQKYFEKRVQIEDGYGDHGLCIAARMAKIYVTHGTFLTKEPDLVRFSLFGGHLNHIHWVSRDLNPCILEWLDLNDNNQRQYFENESFIWTVKESNEKRIVKLKPDNSIEILQGDNWGYPFGIWGCDKDANLMVFWEGDLGKNYPLSVLKPDNGQNKIKIYSSQRDEFKTGSLSDLF